MAVKQEELFNSIKPLCVGYIEATHLLPYMPFIRSKAGSICKAHKISSEEGFQTLYNVLIQSDVEDKWNKYYEALKEAEFNSICRLHEFMQKQTSDFDSYCDIFRIFITEITENQFNIIAFANALKSEEAITEIQLDHIQDTEKKEGINSAAILLFAYFPDELSYLMKDLAKCLNFLGKKDLLKKIQETVTVCEDETTVVSCTRPEMIKLLHQPIVDSVDPRDIWNKLATDLDLPANKFELWNKGDMEKIMTLLEENSYPGKFQSFYDALSDAGYEQICMKIDGKRCHDDNDYYKGVLERQQKDLAEKIKVQDILDGLLTAKVINKRQKEAIDSLRCIQGDTIAAQSLLVTIPLMKNMWYNDFFEMLCKNNQRNVVKMIAPEYNCSSNAEASTDSDTNLNTGNAVNQLPIQRELRPRKLPREIVLRDYQKELISKALLGKNCIIAAPTGSGKTVMAVEIIKDHFHKNGTGCKVIFLCNQIALADQQSNVLNEAFPHLTINVIYGSPESQSKKMESFNLSDIVVMTPQCLVDNLKQGRIKDLSIITLLIIDECHHAYSKHPYNIVMSRYLDDKFDKVNCRLPQVIGLTAVVGIDVTKSGKNAKEHFLEICANLDCEELCITKENVDDLQKHVPVPLENIKTLPYESESALSKVIKSFMTDVHTSINNRELSATSLQFGTTQYIGWLSDAKKTVSSSLFELKHEFASVQCLEKCNKALQMLRGYRAVDAIEMLHDYLDNEPLDTDAFRNLKKMLKRKLEEFETHSTPEERAAESLCLLGLVDLIQKKFLEKPDSRIIVFVETKFMTRILTKVLKEKTETADFNPQYLMAGLNTDTGPGMSINKQKDTLGMFRSGECKLLVSTPVAEEGLDIQKCNLVIDYLTVQGVRSHVQKRGRARAADGEYIQIIGADPLLGKRATVNRIKVDQMQVIVNEVYDEQLKFPIVFKETLKEIQLQSKHERSIAQIQKMKSAQALGTYTLRCTSCNCYAAESSDFRTFEEKCRVIVNPDFRKKITISRQKPTILFDDIKRISSFHCNECGLYWGNQVVYKRTIFDCISIKQFKIVPKGKDPVLAKKWLKVPFRDAVKELAEEDFAMVRKDSANNYEDDFPIPESNPDVTESNSDVTESNPDVTESNLDVTESNPDVTESNPDVTESNPDVTESNPDVA